MSAINASVSSAQGWKPQRVAPSFRQLRGPDIVIHRRAVYLLEEAVIKQTAFFTSFPLYSFPTKGFKEEPSDAGF